MISKMTIDGKDETHKMKLWKFPAGEVGVKLEDVSISRNSIVTFDVKYENSDDIMYMLNLYDALQHICPVFQGCHFYIPYLPYSRQDRVCHEGESFALNVFGQVLGLMPLAKFFTEDLHSHVSKQVIENLIEEPQWCFTNQLLTKDFSFFIAPDKGATSKILNLQGANSEGIEQVVTLNKVRKDGKVIYEDYEIDTLYGKVCVVDDLADAGGTFIALGEMLKRTQPNIQSFSLYVTHGLFTKGLSELESVYDTFYVGNLVNVSLRNNPKVKEI
jgi:ribose-phosphate pyrophosphokinase